MFHTGLRVVLTVLVSIGGTVLFFFFTETSESRFNNLGRTQVAGGSARSYVHANMISTLNALAG